MNEAQMALHLSGELIGAYGICCSLAKRCYVTAYFDTYTYPIYQFKDGSVIDFSIDYEGSDDINIISAVAYDSLRDCEVDRFVLLDWVV